MNSVYIMEGKMNDKWVLPVKKEYYNVTSGFGKREKSLIEGKKEEFHTGIDIAKNGIEGSEVFAFADGVVVEKGKDRHGSLYVIIKHEKYEGYFEENSGFYTVYVHLSEIYVDQGEKVKAKDVLGTVGETGLASGPHLHFETVIGSEPVNPERFIDY